MFDIPNPIDIVTAPFRWGFDQLKSAGSDLIREAFQWLCGLLLSGVSWLFMTVWNFIAEATTPNLYASWFTGGPFAVMRTVAIAVLMLAVILAIAETVWNRDGGALLRSVAQDFPKAVFLLTVLLFVTTLGLGFADALSALFMGMFSGSANDFATAMSNVAGELQFGAGLLVVMFAAVLMVLLLLLLAAAFLLREGFIFFLVAISAVMIAVDVYRPTKGAAGQSMRLLAGVILAKPIVALCFALGGAMLGQANADSAASAEIAEPGTATEAASDPTTDAAVAEIVGEDADDLAATFGTLLAGMATMMVAGVAPIVMLRLVPAANSTATAEAQQAVGAKVSSAASKAAAAL